MTRPGPEPSKTRQDLRVRGNLESSILVPPGHTLLFCEKQSDLHWSNHQSPADSLQPGWGGRTRFGCRFLPQGSLMIYLRRLDGRQSFEAAASRLILEANTPKMTRRFYLYQARCLIFFNTESPKQTGEAAQGCYEQLLPCALCLC